MFIPFHHIVFYGKHVGKPIKGIFHIGAHECQEKAIYNLCGFSDDKIVWIEGNEAIVKKMKERYPDALIYNALIDRTSREVTFHITNNGQSSSILELGTHAKHYPEIVVAEKQVRKTISIKEFIETNKIDIRNLNFWNLDIQGVELEALKGAGEYIQYVDIVYCEVNTEEVYKGCALLPELDAFFGSHGFLRVESILLQQGWGDCLYVRK
jgi:FkbM family methyltransferase